VLAAVCTLVAALGPSSPLQAAEEPRTLAIGKDGRFPAKPIRLVVPFPPGASTDTIARILANRLGEAFSQSVLVDNRGGAGGNIGTEIVTRAAPDGYTWLLGTAGTMTINPSLYPHMKLDPMRMLAPVTLLAEVPNVLVVHPAVPVRSVQMLVEYARRRPGELNYGSAGNGSSVHLGAELFKSLTGTQMVHVPYRGGAPALSDLLGGHIQLMFNSVPLALPYIQSFRVRALAVTSARRSPVLPDVPSMREAGLDTFDFMGWFAVLLPAQTPARMIDWLNSEITATLGSTDLRQRLLAIGATPVNSSPGQLGDLIRRDTTRWAAVIREAGIKPDWTEPLR